MSAERKGGGLTHAEVIAAYSRVSEHDPAALNAVAYAVMDVQGFTDLTTRYAIAVLALENLATAAPRLA